MSLKGPLVGITGASMFLEPPRLNGVSGTAMERSVLPAVLSTLACHDTTLSWLFFLLGPPSLCLGGPGSPLQTFMIKNPGWVLSEDSRSHPDGPPAQGLGHDS